MRSGRSGFTLIELLIVITILGIMAMMVVPHFVGASNSSRGAAMADQLRVIREQMSLYRAEHQGRWPGIDGNGAVSPLPALVIAQLTSFTDRKGNTNSTRTDVFTFGPYLPETPANPISGLKTLKIETGNGTPVPDETTAWIYQPQTGKVWTNSAGSDANGKAYFDY